MEHREYLIAVICCSILMSPLFASSPTAVGQAQANKQSLEPPKGSVIPDNLAQPAKTDDTKKQYGPIQIQTKTVSGRPEIPINSSLPLTGELGLIGKEIFAGMSLLFNKIQREPTLAPFTCNLKALDDGAEIGKARANIDELAKKSPIFLSLFGTETIQASIPGVNNHSILNLFPLDGNTIFRREEYQNLIFFRAWQEQEIEALIGYSVKTLNKKQIAIFYEKSDWGNGAYKTLEDILKKYKLEIVGKGTYQQRTLNVSRGVDDIVAKAPDIILCIASPRPAYNFIRQIINKGLYNTVILGLSSLNTIQTTLRRSRGIRIFTSSVVPNPLKSKLKIAEEYRAALRKYSPNKSPTTFSFEGYINAALLVESMKQLPMPMTTDAIRTTIEGLKNVSFKGLVLNFNPATRTLSQNIWINDGEEQDWIMWKTT